MTNGSLVTRHWKKGEVMRKDKCCICSQIHGDATNDLLAQLIGSETYIRRIPVESESFAVIPSIGPLVAGHVLLSPNKHLKSFAQIPTRLEDEFAVMKKRLSEILAETYGQPVHYFEHGSAKSAEQPMCTVEHAHLHFVPTDAQIWPTIQHEFEWQQIESNIANLSAVVGDMEYIWYESPRGVSAVAKGVEGTFESQYLRKIFARAVGLGEGWNWREFPRVATISDTYATIQCTLRSPDNSLPVERN
jgi:diadenosine tetraphosphate (Ap4A) HIT family hydrolase